MIHSLVVAYLGFNGLILRTCGLRVNKTLNIRRRLLQRRKYIIGFSDGRCKAIPVIASFIIYSLFSVFRRARNLTIMFANYFSVLPLALQAIMNPISLPCQEPSFPANPDWKLQLQEDLSKQPVNFFSLATVSEALTPRVRTLTLSGFLGESGYKSTTKIPSEGQNPPASSDVIFITSDARQNKFRDLEVSLSVEAVFWIPSVGAQWRIKGRGVSIGGTGEQEMKTRTELEQHLTIEGDGASWTWEKEIAKQYELLYFGHKAKFQSTEDPETGISTEFRILGIIPEDVEVYRQKPTETWVNWKVEEGEPHAKWVSKEGK